MTELEALGIGEPELRFELFDGTHGGHRRGDIPRPIGWLAERLALGRVSARRSLCWVSVARRATETVVSTT